VSVYIYIYEIEVDKRHNFTSIQKAKAKAKANRKEIHTDHMHTLFRLLMDGGFLFSFYFFSPSGWKVFLDLKSPKGHIGVWKLLLGHAVKMCLAAGRTCIYLFFKGAWTRGYIFWWQQREREGGRVAVKQKGKNLLWLGLDL
jgi:hypothetical protein